MQELVGASHSHMWTSNLCTARILSKDSAAMSVFTRHGLVHL